MSDPTALVGYGPLQGLPQFVSNTNLDTTPVKITIPTPATTPLTGVKIKIVNGHATQALAWGLARAGAAPPTITAAFATTSGSIVLAANTETFSLWWGTGATPDVPWFDLYLVASGASTPFNITFDFIG